MKIIQSSDFLEMFLDGGKSKGRPDSAYDAGQLARGKIIERDEHLIGSGLPKEVQDRVSKKISKDHLEESEDFAEEDGGEYYDELEEAEERIDHKLEKRKAAMNVIRTESFTKLAKEWPESYEKPYNSWAVCSKNIDRKKDKAKWNRCVKHVRDENVKDKKESSVEIFDLKTAAQPCPCEKLASKPKTKWIPGDLKAGSYTRWCKERGFDSCNEGCYDAAMKSDDARIRGKAQFWKNVSKRDRKKSASEQVLLAKLAKCKCECEKDEDESDEMVEPIRR
jgi:hypothetical protein